MPQQQSPFLEGKYGWNFGEGGWNTGMDENLLKFSFLFDRNVDGIVGSLPAAVNGQAYFLTTDNRLYFAVGTIWYSSPTPKWFEFKIKSTGDVYQFNGTTAVQIDGPANLDTRLDAVELTLSSLGSAAFEDADSFATQAQLDIVEAQSQNYTDVLRQNIANTASPTLGSSLIGRGGQVVGSITGLRGLSKTAASKNAVVTGYYSPGDGGGGAYYLDVADTTTADNGGTVIVASDGGRWKLAHSGTVSIRQFGARGNGTPGDNVFVQAAIDAWVVDSRIGAVYCPAGNYVLSTRVNIPKLAKGLTFFGDGKATSFRGGEGFGGELFFIGSNDPTAGVAYEIKDFIMAAPLSGTSNGIVCKNANVIRFRGITGQNLNTAFNLENCFAVTFKECLFDVVNFYAIYSSTACHNLIIDNCKFFTVGGTTGFALLLDAATDNIVIQNSDFEYCRSVYSFAGASAVVLSGNYIEYCTAVEFVHTGAAVRGWSCVSNWIALHQGTATPWDNILDGEFKFNTLFNITASWGASVQNVDVGVNTIRSGASLATTPFKTVTGYNNSWVAGTRTPSYHKSADGTVYLRGEITGGSLGNLAFNLPAGFRPSQQMRFAVGGGVGANTYGMVIVDSNGNVVPTVGATVSLDGITFKAVTV